VKGASDSIQRSEARHWISLRSCTLRTATAIPQRPRRRPPPKTNVQPVSLASTSEDAEADEAATGEPLASALEPLLYGLEPRMAHLVRLRLGLGPGAANGTGSLGGLSSAAAAAEIGVSRHRADQLFVAAVSALRKRLRAAAGASRELRALLERASASV
jgi:hypothetical protein